MKFLFKTVFTFAVSCLATAVESFEKEAAVELFEKEAAVESFEKKLSSKKEFLKFLF